MMKALLGTKVGMTQLFIDGKMVPVTAVDVESCIVTSVRTPEKDGYAAVQIGYGTIKERRLTKPMAGMFARRRVEPRKHLREVRVSPDVLDTVKVGASLTAETFSPGDLVDVSGTSKGKGLQGPVKRHGFRGFPKSHGSRYHRAGGSIGASAYPSRVFKGTRMPGRMGNVRTTEQNLKVAQVDAARNLLFIRGAVPGPNGGIVMVRKAVKAMVTNDG